MISLLNNVGILLDTIDGMQNYLDELLEEIERFNSEDSLRKQELEAKNEKYKRALDQMRNYVAAESEIVENDYTKVKNFTGRMSINGLL